jgi:hypothetical protein
MGTRMQRYGMSNLPPCFLNQKTVKNWHFSSSLISTDLLEFRVEIQTCYGYDVNKNVCCPYPYYCFSSHSYFDVILNTGGDRFHVRATRYGWHMIIKPKGNLSLGLQNLEVI